MFLNVFFIKVKKTCFYVLYSKINVFIIYAWSVDEAWKDWFKHDVGLAKR